MSLLVLDIYKICTLITRNSFCHLHSYDNHLAWCNRFKVITINRSFVNAKLYIIWSWKTYMREGCFCYIVSSFDNNLLGCGEGWGLSNQPWSKHTMYHVLNLVLTRPLFLVLGVVGRGGGVSECFIYLHTNWMNYFFTLFNEWYGRLRKDDKLRYTSKYMNQKVTTKTLWNLKTYLWKYV